MPFTGRHVVLGVSGGIACYKSCTLARRLTEAGATVDVALTASAAEFVRPVTFEALTGRPVLTSLWERGRALTHIDFAKAPDLVILAPATANILARAAMGMADDLLTTLLLARGERPAALPEGSEDRAPGERFERHGPHELGSRCGQHDIDRRARFGEPPCQRAAFVAGDPARHAEHDVTAGERHHASERRRRTSRYLRLPRTSSSKARVVSFSSQSTDRSRGKSFT